MTTESKYTSPLPVTVATVLASHARPMAMATGNWMPMIETSSHVRA